MIDWVKTPFHSDIITIIILFAFLFLITDRNVMHKHFFGFKELDKEVKLFPLDRMYSEVEESDQEEEQRLEV